VYGVWRIGKTQKVRTKPTCEIIDLEIRLSETRCNMDTAKAAILLCVVVGGGRGRRRRRISDGDRDQVVLSRY